MPADSPPASSPEVHGLVVPHDKSFGFIRGRHIDGTVLGTLRLGQEGNIATGLSLKSLLTDILAEDVRVFTAADFTVTEDLGVME